MLRHALTLGSLFALAQLVGVALGEREARACGGCFHPPPNPNPAPTDVESVVTDHRMVFSISTTQTVLWDQIRYSGDPKEFAWVLPVHPGAKVELSHDAWIAALDASTQTVVTGPQPKICNNGIGYGGGFSEGSGGGGLGCGSTSATSDFAASGGGTSGPTAEDAGATEGVQVVSQSTVGPYQTVTVRASQGDALETWLTNNGFDVPPAMQPTLDAYAKEGFDFIALKLRPGQGIRAMQPVRVVTPGADASLPLRMVAAGIGSHVGLTLYVLGEGRYRTENFPEAALDFTQLKWDPYQGHSNFATLTENAMTAGDGRGWITEAAMQTAVYGGGPNPSLSAAYTSLCAPTYPAPDACDAGSTHASDGGGSDAASDGAASDGAASDAAAQDAATTHDSGATCPPPPPPSLCDDLELAMQGMHPRDVWVTRLRAHLPAGALAVGDLRLEPAPQQVTMTNLHTTEQYTDANYDPCPKATTNTSPPSGRSSDSGCACESAKERARLGTWVVYGLTAIVTAAMLRRRRRAR